MARSSKGQVKLGPDTYDLIPQPWAYLVHEIRQFGDEAGSMFGGGVEGGLDNVIESMGDRVWEGLRIFIPDLMPKHRFMGYRSAEAMEDGTYDPDAARKAPAFAQIVDAFEEAFRVNRLDVARHLKKILPWEEILAEIGKDLAPALGEALSEGQTPTTTTGSAGSPTSPSPNGESGSTPSTAESPTPPLPASSA